VSIALIAPDRDLRGLVQEIRQAAPDLIVQQWPKLHQPEQIEFAVCWHAPRGIFSTLPSLKAASSLGAGIDSLLSDPDLPPELPIGRLTGSRLARDMAAWLLAHINREWFRLDRFDIDQGKQQWRPWSPSRPPRIGLLGTGAITEPLIQAATALGFEIRGWNRRGTGIEGVAIHTGESGLLEMAATVDVLICLLPLTAATRGILNAQLFSSMAQDSILINAGRGPQLVEEDLLDALDQGRPARAILDVFEHEPLPPGHPFWAHPAVRISPHCAAVSQDKETAALILESYLRVLQGLPPSGLVDRERGY